MSSANLTKVPYPSQWIDLYDHFSKNVRGATVEELQVDEALIFEDVIPNGLGTGYFYNTPPSVAQLGVALAVAPNPKIQELAANKDFSPRALVKVLRAHKVLSGLKLLDLGCGMMPGFALAAKSLGAEVHTVDGEALRPAILEKLDSHTIIDLGEARAAAVIQSTSGGAFNYVTAIMIGAVPGHPNFKEPSEQAVQNLGEELLAPGGHYYAGAGLLQKS